jgi:Outer membrane protein beta-barrel domain
MRKFIFSIVCSAIAYLPLQAQSLKYGVKLGVSTTDVSPSDLGVRSGTDSFRLKLDNAGYGYQFGVWARAKLLGLYVQPELLFNSNKATYSLKRITGAAITDSIRTESYNRLDIPIMIGYQLFKTVRVNAGPIAHINIGSTSELTNTSGYAAKFNAATWGYQAGVGIDLGKLGIDLRYEGNFTNFGDHLNFGGNSYQFDKKPTRLIATLAYSF